LSDYVRGSLLQTTADGSVEQLKEQVRNVAEFLGKLTDCLVKYRMINLQLVDELTGYAGLEEIER
jgi:hypothetical protein